MKLKIANDTDVTTMITIEKEKVANEEDTDNFW